MNVAESKQYVKIQFYDQDVGYENLLGIPLGDDLYRLESIPFFIYDISLHDIVTAKPDQAGRLQFLKVVRSSGNTTLRARKSPSFSEIERVSLLKRLQILGCQVEMLKQRLIAIDIPQSVDLRLITDLLSEFEIAWEYANPSSNNKVE